MYMLISWPGSFSRVAELRHIWGLDIKGRIKTNLLSPKSTYGAYFVYKLKEPNWAIKEIQVEFRVYFEGEEEVHEHVSGCKVFLDPSENEQEPCKVREDGWLEVEMGEFFNDGGEDHRVVVCSLMETVFCKSGLVVEGIEFRPKLAVKLQVYLKEKRRFMDWGRRSLFLDPSEDEQQLCRCREDAWIEVEMGEFFNDGGVGHGVVLCSLMEADCFTTKCGMVVEGIEGDGWMEVEMGGFYNHDGEVHQVVVWNLMKTEYYTSMSGMVVDRIDFRPKPGR
ncbi:hypothetical protein FEM48_Zijuj07G0071200 [Ziziphus jujuba var. spinosa]|uniref:F-box protein PP2-B12 n=1 Tax=Ziziphus jujuba var. spinosa TaxID=714518 RepID=A0A978V372_ZIZJJ|nr:hypothetical protein FEM48_Zijuj07G0071200 [Ziziphus jujuba var. spinosa]